MGYARKGGLAMKTKAPELLLELGDHTEMVLIKEHQIPAETAKKVAKSLVDHMRVTWGGSMLYFPKGNALDISDRDQALYDDFTGSNHDDLVRKYSLSLQAVYKIIRYVGAARRADIQPDMFGS
jgi:Mor family transcriptional regulator